MKKRIKLRDAARSLRKEVEKMSGLKGMEAVDWMNARLKKAKKLSA